MSDIKKNSLHFLKVQTFHVAFDFLLGENHYFSVKEKLERFFFFLFFFSLLNFPCALCFLLGSASHSWWLTPSPGNAELTVGHWDLLVAFWLIAQSYLCWPLDGSRKPVDFSSMLIFIQVKQFALGSSAITFWVAQGLLNSTFHWMGMRKGWYDEAA